MRSRLLIAVFLFLLLETLSSSSSGQQSSGTPATSNEHKPLMTLPKSVLDAELRAVGGRSFRLSDYSGKVLVINLWATWCGPCRFETPLLVKLHRQFRSQGVQIVELSTEDPDSSTAGVRRWIRNFVVHYRVGWATPEVVLTLMQGRDAIPQSFVISRSGRIVRRFVGFSPTMTPSLLKLAIQEALKEESDLPEKNTDSRQIAVPGFNFYAYSAP